MDHHYSMYAHFDQVLSNYKLGYNCSNYLNCYEMVI